MARMTRTPNPLTFGVLVMRAIMSWAIFLVLLHAPTHVTDVRSLHHVMCNVHTVFWCPVNLLRTCLCMPLAMYYMWWVFIIAACCFSPFVHRTLFWEDIPSLHSLSLQAIEDFFRRLRFCCACACVVCLYVCACLCGCDCVRACVCVCVWLQHLVWLVLTSAARCLLISLTTVTWCSCCPLQLPDWSTCRWDGKGK